MSMLQFFIFLVVLYGLCTAEVTFYPPREEEKP